MKLNLSNVTLVCIDNSEFKYHELSKKAIEFCCNCCDFGEILHFTDKIRNGNEARHDYSYFIINELHKYIKTDFMLICQWDGFIMNPNAWIDKFFDYDYIGAVWDFNDPESVGNGGFSLRSNKLMREMARFNFDREKCQIEDILICVDSRNYLKEKGFKFATIDIADRFSVECNRWHLDIKYEDQFGFHNILTKGLEINESLYIDLIKKQII